MSARSTSVAGLTTDTGIAFSANAKIRLEIRLAGEHKLLLLITAELGTSNILRNFHDSKSPSDGVIESIGKSCSSFVEIMKLVISGRSYMVQMVEWDSDICDCA